MDRFRYLHYGLSVVLLFVGAKMIAEYWIEHEGAHLISPAESLAVIVAILTAAIVPSVMATRRERRERRAPVGDLPPPESDRPHGELHG